MTTCYRHNVALFVIAALLLAGGVAFLVISGLARVQLYAATRHFRSADCYVIALNETGSRSCAGGAGGDRSTSTVMTSFPCITIVVRYEYVEDDGSSGTGNQAGNGTALLFESLLAAKQPEVDDAGDNTTRNSSKCSKYACSYATTAQNVADVDNYVSYVTGTSPATSSSSRRCYVDPADASRAYSHIVTSTSAVHALWWPGMAISFGFFVLLVAACQTCDEARVCRRRPSLPAAKPEAEIISFVAGDVGPASKSASVVSAGGHRRSSSLSSKKIGRTNSGAGSSGYSTCERATTSSTTSGSLSSRSLLLGSLSRWRAERAAAAAVRGESIEAADRRKPTAIAQPLFDCNTV